VGIKGRAYQQITSCKLEGIAIGRKQEPIGKIVGYKKYKAKKKLFKG
jgi:hypothetical protein